MFEFLSYASSLLNADLLVLQTPVVCRKNYCHALPGFYYSKTEIEIHLEREAGRSVYLLKILCQDHYSSDLKIFRIMFHREVITGITFLFLSVRCGTSWLKN